MELLRKELKNSGQASDVKLLPRELSNGDGMGVATMVTEGWVPLAVAVDDRDTSDVVE